MRRREFLGLVSGAAASWPLSARAQPQGQVPCVGILMSLAESDPDAKLRVEALIGQLQERGWKDGRDVRIELRWFGGRPELAKSYAKELVSLRPAVIVANTAPSVQALRPETSSIPIVFATITDPVGAGFVESLARPGGNITGFTIFEYAMAGKWMELLKEIAPAVSHVGVLYNSENTSSTGYFPEIEVIARRMGMRFNIVSARNSNEIERGIATIAHEASSGLIVLPDSVTFMHRKQIVELTAQHRLPAVFPYRYFASNGGLMSYGVDAIELYRRAGEYVSRILKGARPAELPVQQPTKFEFVINLKTAKALGLTVSPTLLARADEVIE